MKKTQTIEKKIQEILLMSRIDPTSVIYWDGCLPEIMDLINEAVEAERAYIGKNKREAYQMGVRETEERLRGEIRQIMRREHQCDIKKGVCETWLALDDILLLLDKEQKG